MFAILNNQGHKLAFPAVLQLIIDLVGCRSNKRPTLLNTWHTYNKTQAHGCICDMRKTHFDNPLIATSKTRQFFLTLLTLRETKKNDHGLLGGKANNNNKLTITTYLHRHSKLKKTTLVTHDGSHFLCQNQWQFSQPIFRISHPSSIP